MIDCFDQSLEKLLVRAGVQIQPVMVLVIRGEALLTTWTKRCGSEPLKSRIRYTLRAICSWLETGAIKGSSMLFGGFM